MGFTIKNLAEKKEVVITGSLFIVSVWFVFTICVGASLGVTAFKHLSPLLEDNHTTIKPLSKTTLSISST